MELQTLVSSSLCMQWTELWSSLRAVHVLNHWVISPAQQSTIFLLKSLAFQNRPGSTWQWILKWSRLSFMYSEYNGTELFNQIHFSSHVERNHLGEFINKNTTEILDWKIAFNKKTWVKWKSTNPMCDAGKPGNSQSSVRSIWLVLLPSHPSCLVRNIISQSG